MKDLDRKLVIAWAVFAVATFICTGIIMFHMHNRSVEISEKLLAASEVTEPAQPEGYPAMEDMQEMGAADDVLNWWLAESGQYVVQCAGKGFKGDVTIYVNFEADGSVNSLRVDTSTFMETENIGTRVLEESFLSQFIGKTDPLAFGEGVDAVSGASYSSDAVLEALNTALSFIPSA